MESKNELIKIGIKNNLCYYFDYAMAIININYKNILLDDKSTKIF